CRHRNVAICSLAPLRDHSFTSLSVHQLLFIMLVSALQFAPVRADVAYNMRRLRQLAGECSFDLLVLPELAHTGYFFTDRLELLELAEEPATGPFCSWLRTLAAERDGVVISGFAERDGDGRLYNSALIALPD